LYTKRVIKECNRTVQNLLGSEQESRAIKQQGQNKGTGSHRFWPENAGEKHELCITGKASHKHIHLFQIQQNCTEFHFRKNTHENPFNAL